MYITRLLINDFRNLEYIDFEPARGFNFICGPNGSGKTSILEAIHYLALSRSFRTNAYQYLIRQHAHQFTLFANIKEQDDALNTSIGMSRARGQRPIIKLNADSNAKVSSLIDHICVQIMHPQGVDLVTKEAEGRRNFIDWGVYYTNQQFKTIWHQYRKALKQRNSILRKEAASLRLKVNSPLNTNQDKSDILGDFNEVAMWDELIASLSEEITKMRLEYLAKLQEILNYIVLKFLPNFKLKFELNFGWDKGEDLRGLLARNLEKDKALGYTFYGCHRADLKIKNHNISAGATLSRGQLKMLVYAMRLAQGMLLKQQTNRACIYLIDDLNSELDEKAQQVLLDTLAECQHQVFISNIQTNILQDQLIPKDSSDYKIFCLDRGMVASHIS